MKNFEEINVECWQSEMVYESMLAGAEGRLWAKLEDSSHWPVLKEMLDDCKNQGMETLCDVGCGAGALGHVYDDAEYTGVDLQNIIDNVAVKFSPHLNFKPFDITKDLGFLAEYDCLVLGAFIDVMEKPLETLESILKNAKRFVVIHRQHLGKGTSSWLTTSYNNMTSYQSQIDVEELKEISSKNGFSIKKISPVDGQYSILLEKK
tara:strand:- start:661 stop:1278 length:618 start_codon:yes stop_codon:yes gene_type:complete